MHKARSTLFILLAFLIQNCVRAYSLESVEIGWADSYSIGGNCYCQSTYDHGIGDIAVPGPDGKEITVLEACALVGTGPETIGTEKRIYYNTVQCGHGPMNNNGDEQACPGRVDLGKGNPSGCSTIGPKWNFPTSPSTSLPPTSSSTIETASGSVGNGIIAAVEIIDVKTTSAEPASMTSSNVVLLSKYPAGFAVLVKTSKTVESVAFSTNSGYTHLEKSSPYVMHGNSGNVFSPWKAKPGSYVVTIVATLPGGSSEVKLLTFVIQ